MSCVGGENELIFSADDFVNIFFGIGKAKEAECVGSPAWKNCSDQAYSCLRDWRLSAIMGAHLRALLNPFIPWCCDGPMGFRGVLNWAPMMIAVVFESVNKLIFVPQYFILKPR